MVTLVYSLTPPGNSQTYINPDDPNDHIVSPGDDVSGRPGVADGVAIRRALDNLKPLIITVPVWQDAPDASDEVGIRYPVVGFAQIQITDYALPGQNSISVIFWGFTNCSNAAMGWQ